jgi:hypothetical protein
MNLSFPDIRHFGDCIDDQIMYFACFHQFHFYNEVILISLSYSSLTCVSFLEAINMTRKFHNKMFIRDNYKGRS